MLFFLIIIFIDSRQLVISKLKISIILLVGIFLAINLNQNLFIKQTEFFKRVLIVENAKNFTERFQNIKYFAHYDAALKIFKDHPLNGVGSKNFRKNALIKNILIKISKTLNSDVQLILIKFILKFYPNKVFWVI